jgi:hypothetical protein
MATKSQWSATMIGIHDDKNKTAHNSPASIYKRESKEVLGFLEGVHHSRKISHQQVNYADTVQKLSRMQSSVPTYTQNITSKPQENAVVSMKYKEFNDNMNGTTRTEQDLNYRKRLYHREVGRVSAVDGILSGKSPATVDRIFPQKATHTQALAITGTLKAPDANIQPPAVPRAKRWLGNDVGWEK